MRNHTLSKKIFNIHSAAGFTLVELLTAVSIFAVIMVLSIGSLTGIFDANRKTRTLKAVVSNLNLVMETMSKEVRFGTNYHCYEEGESEEPTLPQNCPGGGTSLSFLSSDGDLISYHFSPPNLVKRVNDGDFISITSPEFALDDLQFYVLGAGSDNALQPKVIIKLTGSYSGHDIQEDSTFTLQTLVSQRLVDEEVIPPTPSYPSYPPPEHTLTLIKAGTGTGTVSGPSINCDPSCSTEQATYAEGSPISLEYSPSPGSVFSGWSGDCTGTVNNCDINMDSDKTVTATFDVSNYTIEYLIVAGGGGGGQPPGCCGILLGGGGGAGGLISGSTALIVGTPYNVTVGSGGGPETSGINSAIATLGTALGGGRGGAYPGFGQPPCAAGGSGGGAGADSGAGCAGTGGQGNSGGRSGGAGNSAGGGGGASGPGQNGSDITNGLAAAGGPGFVSSISGSSVTYAVGGSTYGVQSSTPGSGGGGGTGSGNAGSGISGIVIIRYLGPQQATGGNTIICSTGGAPSSCPPSSYTIHTFTSDGVFTP